MGLFNRFRPLLWIGAIPLFLVLLVGSVLGLALLTLPDVKLLNSCMKTSMNQVELCSKSSSYTPLKRISHYLIDAIIVSEDASFFSHHGFDWYEIKESFLTNWQKGKLARGGSTITQQLVKNVFLDKEKSVLRKFREALLTMQVEEKFSKDEILEKYLNVVELGPEIYGVKAAAQYYFAKLPSQLNILESSFLAFLLPNPTLHHVYFKKKQLTDYARQRILGICVRLYRFKKISQDDLEIANFRVLDFPWKDILWERTEMMNTVDEILEDETGESDQSLPVVDENLPDSDPDLVDDSTHVDDQIQSKGNGSSEEESLDEENPWDGDANAEDQK